MNETAEVSMVNRRTLLGRLIAGLAALGGLLLGVPLIGALIAPAFTRRETPWIEVGPLDAFPIGDPRQLDCISKERDGWIEQSVRRSVWVVRSDAETLTVFNPKCTHLSCAYRWEADKQRFFCPCHGGIFDITGKVTGGPPPRPLDTLPVKVEGGTLYIRHFQYKLGISEKIPA
ncbi:MAG: ubiquinol-cytochrome c reductase iron-sulfur subunit [Deltaproteobacteria bacterium]|nr:ubiquinol-cytochrome c reductase iron-sulfur subunit [Deltaproteobacteria bacterium]